MSLRSWTPPPIYEAGHPGWCRVVEAHSREDCKRDPVQRQHDTEEDRRWSNTFLHVDLIEDPKMLLRSLRTFVAGELWAHRFELRKYRLVANDAIDAGDMGSARAFNEHIKIEKAVIAELRRVARELRP